MRKFSMLKSRSTNKMIAFTHSEPEILETNSPEFSKAIIQKVSWFDGASLTSLLQTSIYVKKGLKLRVQYTETCLTRQSNHYMKHYLMENTGCSNKIAPLDRELVPPRLHSKGRVAIWKSETEPIGLQNLVVVGTDGLPKKASKCGIPKVGSREGSGRISNGEDARINRWLAAKTTAVWKPKEVILSDFFLHSILYVLDDCIHQIYISHSIFPLLTFTFVTELIA